MIPPKVKYLRNVDLLDSIAKSKNTYCVYSDPKYAVYHAIVDSTDKIDASMIAEIIASRLVTRATRDLRPLRTDEVVFRVMTDSHLPPVVKGANLRTNAVGNLEKANFKPFRHYCLIGNELVEVGRSHWKGAFEDGMFCVSQGRFTDMYCLQMMKLVSKYANRSNYRNYSFNSEMQASALLQLMQVGLQFDEARSDNPFAWLTQVIKNVFTRILNLEARQRDIRDEILLMHGSTPSHTKQMEDWTGDEEPKPKAITRRKRKS